jgi:medium-chain acyl-[acyl-carrier-protein] hydrolase
MAQRTRSPWFVQRGAPRPDARPLYVVPHAGAGAAAVHSLVGSLAGRLEAFAVRLPGRESRVGDEFFVDLELLASELAREIRHHASGDSPVLYGHCGGATIAYETARRLKSEDGIDVGLAVSSHPAPGLFPREPSWRLPRADFLERVRRDGYLPDGLLAHDEMMAIYEPILRADYELIEKHELARATQQLSGPGFHGPILTLFGTQDATVSREQIQAWEALCTGELTVVTLAAGHDLPHEVPHELANALVRRFG